jgi:hypothetical protein
VAASGRDNFSTSKARKEEVVTMLKAQLGDKFKRNSLATYIDDLLQREINETADPSLAQIRVLEGTLNEHLASAGKRTQGRKRNGNHCTTA